MPSTVFRNIRIAGVAGAAPTKTIKSTDHINQVGEDVVNRVINVTGIEQVQRAIRRQTASDLGVAAARKIIEEKQIDVSLIAAVVDVTEFPDYRAPSTAFTIQSRLGIPQDCIAFDVNLGCTGYVYGLHICSALLQAMPHKKYVLLIVGDVPKNHDFSDRKNPDHSYLMMFGDAGTATLLERTDDGTEIVTDLYADGSDFKKLYTLGGARCVDASHEVTVWSDGVERSLFDPYMDGMGVFAFSTKVGPRCIKDFLKEHNETVDDYKDFYLHQANKMIVERIAKLAKIDPTKIPMSLTRYGNTNCGTIPVTIVDHLGNNNDDEDQKVMFCGYGVGLSWGVVSAYIRPADVFPMIFTDEFWEDGEVQPR